MTMGKGRVLEGDLNINLKKWLSNYLNNNKFNVIKSKFAFVLVSHVS